MIGKIYLEHGKPVTVLIRWNGKGPRNVLIQRQDGTKVVRPFRGLRKPGRTWLPQTEESMKQDDLCRVSTPFRLIAKHPTTNAECIDFCANDGFCYAPKSQYHNQTCPHKGYAFAGETQKAQAQREIKLEGE